MPNMASLYRNERTARLANFDNYLAPPDDFTFDLRVDTEIRRVSSTVYLYMPSETHTIIIQLGGGGKRGREVIGACYQ